jgi:hypothetical protein
MLDKHLGSAGRGIKPPLPSRHKDERVSHARVFSFFSFFSFFSPLLFPFFSVTISSRHSSRRMRFGKEPFSHAEQPSNPLLSSFLVHPDKYLERASERTLAACDRGAPRKIEIYFKSAMRKASLRRILHAPDSLDRLFTLP